MSIAWDDTVLCIATDQQLVATLHRRHLSRIGVLHSGTRFDGISTGKSQCHSRSERSRQSCQTEVFHFATAHVHSVAIKYLKHGNPILVTDPKWYKPLTR